MKCNSNIPNYVQHKFLLGETLRLDITRHGWSVQTGQKFYFVKVTACDYNYYDPDCAPLYDVTSIGNASPFFREFTWFCVAEHCLQRTKSLDMASLLAG